MRTPQNLFVEPLQRLLPDEEVTKMVEKFLEQDSELLNTPYLRKMRRIGWEHGLQEGRAAGWAEGRAQGRAEGRAKGLVEGRVDGWRKAILDGLIVRFNPPASEYRTVQEMLEQVAVIATLRLLITALFDAPDFVAFRARVSQESEK